MKLSIVIPTRNRADALSATLESFCQIIESSSRRGEVELVCVNNFSRDNTTAVVERFARRYPFVRSHHQAEERKSAETSAFYAIDFARGEYVWLFGDDDTPLEGCVDTLITELERHDPSFALLNLLFDRGDETSEYINSVHPTLYFPVGLDFFRRFGMITAVTTISCICFKKATYDRSLFNRFAAISEIYSHTFGLLANYHASPVLFVATPLLKYLATHESIELEKIGGHSKSKGLSTYYSFGHGLARLIVEASRITGIPVATIAAFEEIVIDKSLYVVRPMLLWTFIVRTFIIQHENDLDYRFGNDDIAELRNAARQLGNATAQLCWEACLQLATPRHRLRDRQVVDKLTAIIADYEESYFQSARVEHAESYDTLYYQNGVVANSFFTGSPRGRMPTLSVLVNVAEADDKRQIAAALARNQQSLAPLTAQWLTWDGENLPAEELGECVAFVSGKSLLFPNSLLFALNLLHSRDLDAVEFNRCGHWVGIENSNFFGDLPRGQLLDNMSDEEVVALNALHAESPGEIPLLARVASLKSGFKKVAHLNCPLAIDVQFVTEESPAMSGAATQIAESSRDPVACLHAFNKLTIGGLVSRKAVAPVLPEAVWTAYNRGEVNPTSRDGAIALENLLQLLAIRTRWDNRWKFNEAARSKPAVELRDWDEALEPDSAGGSIALASERELVTPRLRRQRRYTAMVRWVNARPKLRAAVAAAVRVLSQTKPLRKQLTRLHQHYYRPAF